MAKSPDIFAYDDFRAYLRGYYDYRKQQGRGFSLRTFSRQAALTSSNYLKLVMDGDRNLSGAMAERFAKACGLRGPAADFFCELVAYGQAETAAERERAYRRLSSFRRFRDIYPLDRAHEAYHSQWFIPAVRELAARHDFRADPGALEQVKIAFDDQRLPQQGSIQTRFGVSSVDGSAYDSVGANLALTLSPGETLSGELRLTGFTNANCSTEPIRDADGNSVGTPGCAGATPTELARIQLSAMP